MKTTLIWACIFGITAIAIGALGAHGLKQILGESELDSLATGVRYQMYHSLFLLFIGVMQHIKPDLKLNSIRNLTVIGVFFFSFSIYLLLSQTPLGLTFPFIWVLTPIGGILLMAAWMVLLIKIVLLSKVVEM